MPEVLTLPSDTLEYVSLFFNKGESCVGLSTCIKGRGKHKVTGVIGAWLKVSKVQDRARLM